MEWYGLNDSVVSIMDGGNLGLPFVKDSTHCDNLTGPATYDINRVHEYFRDGNLTEFDVQRVAGDYQAIISWKDEAWAEFNHELYFFYRLDGQGTDTFDRYYTYPYTERVGVHEDIARDPDSHRSQSQTMRQSINTTVHRAGRNYVLPDYTGYAACGRAYFSQFESRSSTLRCTNEILISNADHNEQFTSTSTPTATPTSTPTPTATTTPTATPTSTPSPRGNLSANDYSIEVGDRVVVTASGISPPDFYAGLRLSSHLGFTSSCGSGASGSSSDHPGGDTFKQTLYGCEVGNGTVELVHTQGNTVVDTIRIQVSRASTATPEPTPTATPEPTPPPPNDECYYEPELPQCNDGYE